VQCKQWRATKVGVRVVRELYGVMAARGAVSAYVVTSGTFTKEARKFARGRNIILIDGKALEREIRRQAKSGSNITDIASARRERDRPTQTVVVPDAPPDCPNCGAGMVKRVAKQGSHAGKAFWGCSRFPKCRGIRALE
jgi:restriction system protein